LSLEGDAEQVRLMIEWAASVGVEMSSVAIGACTVTLMPPRSRSTQMPERQANTAYSQFGGKLFKDLVDKPEVEGEFEPAVRNR
jgi:hypothetical protein